MPRFLPLEKDIITYMGAGDPVELEGFKTRSQEIRQLISQLYEYLFNNAGNLDPSVLQNFANQIESKYSSLKTDFENFKDRNSQTCKLTTYSCGPSEVANLRSCACVNINGYDKLNATRASIPVLRSELNAIPNLDAKNNASMNNNLDIIAKAIDDLKLYVETYAKNLDEKYVQDRVNQILTWYDKVKSDLALLKEGRSIEICSPCLNNRWVQEAGCKCVCEVVQCPSLTQAIDYYGCQCVDKNSCTKTKESCAADENKILDYVNCECKAQV
jgi:hypothetical protein